jgi:outer membrane scaffolding protein for murein synthesis (MipA/OmpV family)
MMRGGYRRLGLAACGVVLAGLLTGPAAAQTPSPMGFWQFSAGEVLVPLDLAPKWRITVGPTVSYGPKYEGSQHYEIQPGLNVEIRYRERLYLSSGEGLGYDIVRTRNWRAGVSITYDLGREANITELRGLGDVQAAPQFRLYGEYVLRPKVFDHEFPIILSATVLRAIGGYDGTTADAGLYMPIAGSEEGRWFIFAGASANYADQNTLQTYFGISAEQAARTHYPIYYPRSGFRSYGAGVDMGWFFTEHWLISGSFGGKWLQEDAAKSPIVFDRFQFTSNIAIGYQF